MRELKRRFIMAESVFLSVISKERRSIVYWWGWWGGGGSATRTDTSLVGTSCGDTGTSATSAGGQTGPLVQL